MDFLKQPNIKHCKGTNNAYNYLRGRAFTVYMTVYSQKNSDYCSPPPTVNIKVTNKGINNCKYLLGRLLVLTTKSRKLKPLPTPIES